jgi:cyclophilin family peptidyl-prolyl cis-trans isomerase/HEAT repeat protein
VALLSVLLSACAPPDAGRGDPDLQAYARIVAAQDARPAGGPELELLLEATREPRPFLRRAAVQGLGRLENPALVDEIVPLLDDADPTVRAAAADALAQAVHRGSGEPVLEPLRSRITEERSPAVLAALARALGRLDLEPRTAREVGRVLVHMSRDSFRDAPGHATLEGVVLGMESLARGSNGQAVGPLLADRLQELVERGPTTRIRTVALLALGALEAPGARAVSAGLSDREAPVRRVAATLLARTRPRAGDFRVVRLLDDAEARVRLEGVRVVAGAPPGSGRCRALMDAAREDDDTSVRLAALDALVEPCPEAEEQRALLQDRAASLPEDESPDWHEAAHALVALAGVDAVSAAALLPDFVDHPDPFVRAWSARAAGRLGRVATLRSFLRDPDDNVLTAALPSLVRLQGRGADDVLLAALAEHHDAQLILTAADLLHGTNRTEGASVAALLALRNLTEEGLETLRDPRLALLDLLEEVGDSTRVRAVEPYLRDYDPAVARKASQVLLAWTGKRWIAAPRGSEPLPLPTADDIRAMEGSTVALHMERGGTIEIRLLPLEAPTNAFRLFRLARSGALDGLTFHRVVPNFVIQGGSPGANEYTGHGAFTRDEVGLVAQWRGTVGVSTRGRDTGDGQIYVNLVDNVRLDHDYTILGRVGDGMGTVDAVREGDVILRAEARMHPSAAGR